MYMYWGVGVGGNGKWNMLLAWVKYGCYYYTEVTVMKTPERSRTPRVSQIVQTFCPKVPFLLRIERRTQIHYVTSHDIMTSYCDLTWHHDVILWCHMKSHHRPWWLHMGSPFSKSLEITFSDLVSLTFDLRPWPTILAYPRSGSIFMPKIKVICQTVQTGELGQTHRQADKQTNGRYQMHYLPCFAVDKNEYDLGPNSSPVSLRGPLCSTISLSSTSA